MPVPSGPGEPEGQPTAEHRLALLVPDTYLEDALIAVRQFVASEIGKGVDSPVSDFREVSTRYAFLVHMGGFAIVAVEEVQRHRLGCSTVRKGN
jgi:hypothetical protein